jgi:tetratricopeptide (TPR) repeat protein
MIGAEDARSDLPEPIERIEHLERIERLCDKALYLQAYALAEPLGPLDTWKGARARLVAVELASSLGAPQLGKRIALKALRDDPSAADVRAASAQAIIDARGPLGLWMRLRSYAPPLETSPEARARVLRVRARVASMLRDFDTAARILREAEAAHQRDASILNDEAFLLARQDRYEEALTRAREALEIEPLHQGALHQTALLLVLLDQRDEAARTLAEAEPRMECASVALHLSTIHAEQRRYADEQRSLDRVAALSPLIEPAQADLLASRRSDCAYHLGDAASAIELAKQSKSPFFQRIAARLSERPTGRRVLLDVGFTRQHHLTCVPATLSTVGRFWKKPTSHLEVAEAICYDGTPAHSERRWAEQNGWEARELTLTWEAAVALLDRGIPFTLTLADASNEHMQAVIGYDERRGTLYIRDPYIHVVIEAASDLFIERYKASGPRAMAIVPREEAQKLSGIELPDAPLYDLLHALNLALVRHERGAATEALLRLSKEAPGHRLAIMGRRAIHAYDADAAGLFAAAEDLLRLYPGDGRAELTALACLQEIGGRAARVARLEAICAREGVDPIFYERLAAEIDDDARGRDRARRLLWRSLRLGPERAEPFGQLANILWSTGRFDEALEMCRFAACIEPTNESGAKAYFIAARIRGRAAEAIELLEKRSERLGARSARPVMTLFEALEQVDRATDAFDRLGSALARRPDDGELLLFAAEAHARYGRVERARELLAAAEGKAKRALWLRAAAAIADVDFEESLSRSIALWREVLELEPVADDAHRAVAERLLMTEGRDAARDHLAAASARFPRNRALLALLVQALEHGDPAALEAAARRLVELEPGRTSAHRALARALAAQDRLDEARKVLDVADQIEPFSSAQKVARGRLASIAGETDEAREAFRAAIRASADSALAIAELTSMARTPAEIEDELAFIEGEVLSRSVTGEGIAAWFEAARRRREPEALLAKLGEVKVSRPDLAAVWVVRAQQLADTGRAQEAVAEAREAAARFPLLTSPWLALADVSSLCEDDAGEIEALTRALALSPGLIEATTRLAAALARAGDAARARAVLERASSRSPLDPALLFALAEALWRAGEREAAIERLRRSLTLGLDGARPWELLYTWCHEVGRPESGLALAKESADKRPWDAGARLTVARMEESLGRVEEALATAEAALRLKKGLAEGHLMRAALLTRLSRRDEAIAACSPPDYPGELPVELRGQAAWIKALFGDIEEASADMRRILEDRPDYLWGWMKLADMAQEAGDSEEQLKAALAMVRLAPRSPLAHKYEGDARLRRGDKEGAEAAFARAAALAPRSTSKV